MILDNFETYQQKYYGLDILILMEIGYLEKMLTT